MKVTAKKIGKLITNTFLEKTTIKNVKTLSLLFILTFSVNSMYAQTKEETLTWLKRNLPSILYVNNKYDENLKILSVNECELEVSYSDKEGDGYIITYSTEGVKVDEYSRIKYESDAGPRDILSKKNGKVERHFIGNGIYVKDDYKDEFLKKMKHLGTFCQSTKAISWKAGTQKDAVKWLREIFEKYGYIKNDKYDKPRIKVVDDCKIVIEYDYYESALSSWGNPEKTGTITELIYYKDIDRLVGDDDGFRSDNHKIYQKFSHNKSTEESYASIIGIKYAYPELHDNILKTMKFLNDSYCKSCGFLCDLIDGTIGSD